jgi:hypothetical protein
VNHLADEAIKHGAIPYGECPRDHVVYTKHSGTTHRLGHYVDDETLRGWCVSSTKYQVINGLLWEYEEATK